MIQVYDNFFQEDIRLEILEKLMRPNWGISGGNPTKPEIFWHYDGLEKNIILVLISIHYYVRK